MNDLFLRARVWRATETVLDLCRGIVTDQAWDRLGILADAFEDAGMGDPEMLQALRLVGAGWPKRHDDQHVVGLVRALNLPVSLPFSMCRQLLVRVEEGILTSLVTSALRSCQGRARAGRLNFPYLAAAVVRAREPTFLWGRYPTLARSGMGSKALLSPVTLAEIAPLPDDDLVRVRVSRQGKRSGEVVGGVVTAEFRVWRRALDSGAYPRDPVVDESQLFLETRGNLSSVMDSRSTD